MNRLILLLVAAALTLDPLAAASRQDKAAAELKGQLQAHITELASDAYQGREPGTEGGGLLEKGATIRPGVHAGIRRHFGGERKSALRRWGAKTGGK